MVQNAYNANWCSSYLSIRERLATYTTQNTRDDQLHRQWGSYPQLQQPGGRRPHGHRYRLGATLRPTIKHPAVNIEYYARLNFRSNYPARKPHVFGAKLRAAHQPFLRLLWRISCTYLVNSEIMSYSYDGLDVEVLFLSAFSQRWNGWRNR